LDKYVYTDSASLQQHVTYLDLPNKMEKEKTKENLTKFNYIQLIYNRHFNNISSFSTF